MDYYKRKGFWGWRAGCLASSVVQGFPSTIVRLVVVDAFLVVVLSDGSCCLLAASLPLFMTWLLFAIRSKAWGERLGRRVEASATGKQAGFCHSVMALSQYYLDIYPIIPL